MSPRGGGRKWEVPALPGLRGVRPLHHCDLCGRHREGEGWRVERGHRVEWRRSPVEGAIPACGPCLVRAFVRLVVHASAGFAPGRGGAWLRRASDSGRLVESMGPRCWRRALSLGLAARVPALEHLRGLLTGSAAVEPPGGEGE